MCDSKFVVEANVERMLNAYTMTFFLSEKREQKFWQPKNNNNSDLS